MPHDPAYPPQQTWRFPPPPLARRWVWLAWIATVLGAAALAAGVTLAVVAGNRDAPGLIDDPKVLARIEASCSLMTSTVEAQPSGRTPRERSLIVTDQNAAVDEMIDRIEALDSDVRAGDRPLEAWLDDWRALTDARDSYAALVARGGPEREVVVPFDERGRPITERMEDALLDDVCPVPEVLIDPGSSSNLST